MVRDKALKRIKFSDITWREIKSLAGSGESAIYVNLESFFEAAVSFFLVKFPEIDESNYLPVPRTGRYHSLWIQNKSLLEVKRRSQVENAFENRIIYTAVIFYLSRK